MEKAPSAVGRLYGNMKTDFLKSEGVELHPGDVTQILSSVLSRKVVDFIKSRCDNMKIVDLVELQKLAHDDVDAYIAQQKETIADLQAKADAALQLAKGLSPVPDLPPSSSDDALPHGAGVMHPSDDGSK